MIQSDNKVIIHTILKAEGIDNIIQQFDKEGPVGDGGKMNSPYVDTQILSATKNIWNFVKLFQTNTAFQY